jgi:vacuolar protein sorting-associated protein VTA1
MPLTIPPELKKITPFVRRAEELDKDPGNPESRLVAYYCRQYAVHTGIASATSAAGKGVLGELLGSLEKEKESMNSFTRDEAKFLCRKFADKIFDKADLEDRTGDATKDTAKTFYAAASFLEIMQQFYKDDDQSEEREEGKKRAVYSKWKATEILKAIKEGRQHAPGGYGEDEEEPEEKEVPLNAPHDPSPQVETVADDDDDDEEEPSTLQIPAMEEEDDEEEPIEAGTEVELPPPSYPGEAPSPVVQPSPPARVNRPPVTFSPPPVPPPPMAMPAPPTAKPQPQPEPTKPAGFFGLGKKKKLSKAEIADATELTRFALAALEDKNVDVAADRLKQALHTLGR